VGYDGTDMLINTQDKRQKARHNKVRVLQKIFWGLRRGSDAKRDDVRDFHRANRQDQRYRRINLVGHLVSP
jgi:hypothetical protein